MVFAVITGVVLIITGIIGILKGEWQKVNQRLGIPTIDEQIKDET